MSYVYDEDSVLIETKYVHVVESKHPDLLEYYKKTKIVRTRYYPNGKKYQIITHINKLGTEGKNCREILYSMEEFRLDGTRSWYYKSKCDCHRTLYKTYNRKGQLLKRERSYTKRLY